MIISKKEGNDPSINKINQNKLRDLRSAADYLGLKEYALKNIFYNIYNRKQPQPTYLGDRLYFTTKALDNLVELNTHTEV
tara:strand:- start:1672 stop:1911 length:240 start_codon:yes stop_codon:yes gene_type:complete